MQRRLVERVVEFSENYDLVIMGASLDWGIQEWSLDLELTKLWNKPGVLF